MGFISQLITSYNWGAPSCTTCENAKKNRSMRSTEPTYYLVNPIPVTVAVTFWGTRNIIIMLVGGFNHLEKYESQWEGLSHIL